MSNIVIRILKYVLGIIVIYFYTTGSSIGLFISNHNKYMRDF